MPATFISYRRDDAAGYAGRLHEALERRLGHDQIFRDVDTLKPGLDFVDTIDSRLRDCRVLLALVGQEWLDARDRDGQRRLDQPHDYVRLEIAGALARSDVRVIPVLIEGASMPAPDALPENIRPLARRQAVNLREDAWDHDVDRLASVIAEITGTPLTVLAVDTPTGRSSSSALRWLVPAAAVVVLGALVLYLTSRHDAGGPTIPPDSSGSSTTSPGTPGADPKPVEPYGVAVPRVAEVAHTLIYTLISANVTPLGNGTSELRLRFQFANYGRRDTNARDASFRLLVGGESMAPTGGLNKLVSGHSLEQGIVTFTIPERATGKATLRVLEGSRIADLPLDLSTTRRPAEDEQAAVPDSLWRALVRNLVAEPRPLVRADDLSVTLLRVTSRRFANVVRLTCAIRLTNAGQRPVGAAEAALRVAVGDEVLAPMEPPNMLVESHADATADVEFELPPEATRAVLRGSIGRSSGEVPLDLEDK